MIYVIFPAWNEARVIRPTLLALAWAVGDHRMGGHAVLVDDGSTDGTLAEADRAVAESGGRLSLTVLRHETNRGLGAALRTGIQWCLEHAGEDDIVVTLDADNTQPPATIPAMVARLAQGFDVVIASRYREGSQVRGVPAHRRALSDAARAMFRMLYPIDGVRDYTCCFRAYRVSILRRAQLAYGERLCTARGFEAVMDLLLRLGSLGARVSEIGFVLDYGDRVGQSKMKIARTIRSTLTLLLRRRWERMTVDTPQALDARIADAERELAAGAAGPSRAAA